MKTGIVLSAAIAIALGLAGCASKDAGANLKQIEVHKVGDDLTVALMNDTGELKQGDNKFVVQFQNAQGKPVDIGEVRFGSSMSMPSMAPMSGQSEITPAGQTGTYRVKSNFAMSGAWHFTLEWNGPRGQGKAAFNTNAR
jgi:hypothetical protein